MTQLGKYTLHESIGSGGFATVYRATHNTLGTEVAVKVLSPALTHDETNRLRFIREAKTASSLEHPGIVRVLNLIEEPDQVAIVMEWMPGGDLLRWQQECGPLSREQLVHILTEIAAALDYAHAQGVIHRDVKPSNILMDQAGHAHLADFGLVALPGAPHLTRIGSVVGSATYLSPEQAEGRELNGRSDQYSLAITAYQLLAGRPPFQGENSTAISLMHLSQSPPPAASFNPEIPAEVDQALLRALSKKPDDRFSSCAEFVRALETAFHAGDLRRFRELLDESRALLEQGKYEAAGQRIDEARRRLPENADLRGALADLESARQRLGAYQSVVRQWETAQQKARTVLDLTPDYPDPLGIFAVLGLRKAAPARIPPDEAARQAGVGLLLGAAGVVLLFLIAYLYTIR